mgnify:CR=1 FL=1
MSSESISAGMRAYQGAGASEDLAQAMMEVYNPLYGKVRLSILETLAYRDVDFRAVGFLYLFKGDKAKARTYLEIADAMCDELTRRNINKIFDKWDDVCRIIEAARKSIDMLIVARKQTTLDKLLE